MKSRGFTLIELLVVIVIIGILVAIALPNFIRIKDKAKEAEVKQNCHAIQLALERYAVDSYGSVYPMIVMGGDWTDYYVVWLKWVEDQQNENLNPDNIPKYITWSETWEPAPDIYGNGTSDVGDPLVMEAYMPSYPGNPFIKTKSHSLLPDIEHNSINLGVQRRIVGGRESNKMYEVFGPVWLITIQSVQGDFFVHHMFNNPPYDVTDFEKTPPGGWSQPSGNTLLSGNFSYWPRSQEGTAFPLTGKKDPQGYTLAGYGSVRTPGQDVYNRNGNYKGRFRTEPCNVDCAGNAYPEDVPCICNDEAPPSYAMNNGGSDTLADGVIITLDSGVDKASKRTNFGVTEGEASGWST